MIPLDKATRGIVNYIENELLTQLSNDNPKKIGFGVFVALAARDPMKLIGMFINPDILYVLGVVNQEHNAVDIEILRDELKKRIPSEGTKMNLPLLGTATFTAYDIDKMVNYIMSA